MADAQSRVTVTFVGQDSNLGSTAAVISQQLGAIATNAATLTGRLGELNQASQTYATGLKATSNEAEKLFQTNSKLTGQRVKEELTAQAAASKELAAAQKAQQTEAEKIFQTNARLTGQRVKEELTAQASAERELAAAQKAQQTEAEKIFQTNARLTGQKVSEELEKQRQGYQTLAVASGAVAAGIGGLFAKGVESYTKFSGSITQLGVVTQTTGTEKIGALRTEIERLAAATSKTPTEIAALSVSLARAGFTADKIKESLAGIVQGAEATNTVPEIFGKVVGAVIESYQLQASESTKVSDALVAGSNAAGLKIDELGEAFKRAGPTAAGANQSYKETIATLGILRAANLEGSIAGSGYVAILNRLKIASAATDSEFAGLVKGNKQMVVAFKELQVSARNADGSLKPLSEIVPQIQAKLSAFSKGDSDILKKALFGEQGSAAFNALTAVSKERIDQITTAVDNSAGAAATASKILTGDLAGSFNVLKGSTELLTNKFGEFAAVGLLPLVQGATNLINTFLALPAPVQGTLIAITGFIGVVAAATTAIAAYNLANKTLAIAEAGSALATIAETLATQGAAAAKFLFTTQITLANVELAIFDARLALSTAATAIYTAVIEGASAALGGLSTALLTVVAPLAALAAGVAIVGLVKLTEQIGDQNNALEELRAATDQVLQSGINAETRLKSAIDTRNESRRTGITLTQQQIDKEKEVLSQAAGTLDLLKQQLADAEKVPKVQPNFFRDAADTLTSGEIGLDGSFKKNDTAGSQNNARDSNIASLKAQIGTIEDQRKALEGATAATDANSKSVDGNSKSVDGNKGDRKKAAQDQGEDRREARQDAKAKEDAAFQDQQRTAQQKFQDSDRRKEQVFNDEKAQRATKFQDAQSVIEKQNQTEKQQREFTFQNAQATIEKQNQTDKQQREAAFQEKQHQAEATFKEGQRQRDAALKSTQTEAGQQLDIEGARGKDRRKLLQQKQTQDNVAKLSDSDLQGLTPEALAALAKKTAGVDNVRNKRDAEQAQIALKAITDRQNAALKEKERKEDEAFKAKQKAEDLKFKVAQEEIDAKKETEKRARDRQFKVEQEAIDAQKETEKRTRDRQFKVEQDGLDRQHETEKREAQRQFESQQREVERGFKEEQRQKDRANADEIKKIIESAKVDPPKIPPAPIPRFTGGEVSPGQTYLGGEGGVERIDFGGGRDALVGSRGPQLFSVDRPGYVHPHHSPYTQAVIQTTHYQHQTAARSPNVHVAPTVVYSDDALLREMRHLRSDVGAMRSVNQNFDITTQNPMDEVYKAQKIAARVWR